ncbi:MAG: T9SS type A sorting domain-containing protein [Bacteroidia bacterium]|nr:T9SS type A sorting domain-containing protein [Bacteroidia bacterium]
MKNTQEICGWSDGYCTGWGFTNFTDLATIRTNEIIYFQVHMVTIDGDQWDSPISEYRIKSIITDSNPHFPSKLICKNYVSSIHKETKKIKSDIVIEGTTIKLGNETNESIEVKLTDFSGLPIQFIKSNSSEIFLNINKSGLYFLTIKRGNSIQTEKIFIN